jgi:outer membrane protein
MKNLSLILNAILLVAVAVLFYFQFRDSKSNGSTDTAGMAPSKIAYINSDTVLKYYEFTKVNVSKLEEKGKRMEQDLKNRAMSLQSEIENYQRTRNSLTIGQAQAIEEDLGKKQQNFQMYQQSAAQQIDDDQNKMSRELYDKVTLFLNKYGKANGLQMVLKFNPSSDLLYVSDSMDISRQVIDGLNAEYKNETTVKKDSVDIKKK